MLQGDFLIHRVILGHQDTQVPSLSRRRGLRTAVNSRRALGSLVRDQCGQAVEQLRLFERFEQAFHDAEVPHFLVTQTSPQRGGQHHFDRRDLRIGMDRARQHQPVHFRHAQVGDHDLERAAGCRGVPQAAKRVSAALGILVVQVPCAQIMM